MTTDEFNRFCEELLVGYNRRNTATAISRLESLFQFLRDHARILGQMELSVHLAFEQASIQRIEPALSETGH